jgi:hypothetical protein
MVLADNAAVVHELVLAGRADKRCAARQAEHLGSSNLNIIRQDSSPLLAT